MKLQRPRPWVAAIAIGWGVILVAGIVWSAMRPAQTTRDQTTVAQAQPVVDEAVARIVTAATADGLAVASIGDFERGRECQVSLVRDGARYQRAVNLFVAPGTEQALMGRIADRLPTSYHARVSSGKQPWFTADAGLFVSISGGSLVPGQVRLVVDTGVDLPVRQGDCRVVGELAAAVGPGTVDRSPIDAVLARLHLTEAESHTYAVACPNGGRVTTLMVVTGGMADDLDTALTGLGEPVLATADTVAYRVGDTGVGVRALDQRVTITATSGC